MQLDRDQARDWMDRASDGDDGAFSSLAQAAQDDLYRFALAQGLSAADAAEAVQESLLRAYGARGRWHNGADAARQAGDADELPAREGARVDAALQVDPPLSGGLVHRTHG